MKNILILGGGGFIGGHLAKKLYEQGNFVRVVDLKNHEYFKQSDFCSEFILGDLRDPNFVSTVMFSPKQISIEDNKNSFDEVYQLLLIWVVLVIFLPVKMTLMLCTIPH